MFQKALNVFKVEDLRKRIVLTLTFIFVYRLGYQIPLPGISMSRIHEIHNDIEQHGGGGGLGGLLNLMGVLSAGDVLSFGIFSLGIMPYISSSIIFSILAKVVPSIETMVKEGSQGQKKLNQWMRWGTVPICILQAIFMIQGVVLNPATYGIAGDVVARSTYEGQFPGFFIGFYLPALLALTAGTVFLMWIGEQITEHGVGNGISLLIMAGIVSRFVSLWQDLSGVGGTSNPDEARAAAFLKLALFVGLYLGISLAVVYVTKGSRRIPVQYARMVRGRGVYGGQKHYMPLKVNQANVMPVIFASTLMAVPGFIFGRSFLDWSLGEQMFSGHTSWMWTVGYIALIFFFSFFWVQLMFQPSELAKTMKEHGAFVPGIRPGKATQDFLADTLARLTLAGCFFLAMISLVPDVVSNVVGLNPNAAGLLGGTSILIVVAVALDLVDRMNAQLLMRNYEGFMKGGAAR